LKGRWKGISEEKEDRRGKLDATKMLIFFPDVEKTPVVENMAATTRTDAG
jgi:hypothetical protein